MSLFVTKNTIEIVRIQLAKPKNYEAHFKDCRRMPDIEAIIPKWRILHLHVDPKEAAQFKFPYCCKDTFQYRALQALAAKED